MTSSSIQFKNVSRLAIVCACFVIKDGIGAAVDFNRQIRPILAENCFECHGPDARARKAKLRLDTRRGIFADGKNGAIIVPGKATDSELIRRVTSVDPEYAMPPKIAHRRPTAEQIELLRQWVNAGADYAEHWAFLPPRRQSIPQVKNAQGTHNEIDFLVRSKLDETEWQPRPEASRETLIRRLSLDLCGLPPTPREVEHFVRDASPRAYESLVDRLLKSERFGEHMAWGWMEAARYSDTDGFQSDSDRSMWRWRDWIIEAFNRNLPFDQFTIEQLAGDLLPNATLDQRLATGFNRNHRYDKGSGTIQSESVFENATDRLETTATVWLGLTVGCARCHDHKFDPISSREYYEMLAFFDKVPENGQAILDNSHPRLKTPTREQQARLMELDRNLLTVRQRMGDAEPRLATAQLEWEKSLRPGNEFQPVPRYGLKDRFKFDEWETKGHSMNGQVRLVPGVHGKAMAFDGRAYYEFNRSVGNLWAKQEWTFSFWFKLDDLRDGVLISELDDPEDKRIGTLIEIKDRRLRFLLSARWNYAVSWFELKEKLAANRWYHFALTCDGRVQMLAHRVYLDGVETPIHVIQDSSVDGKKNHEPFILGHSRLWPGFRGAIDEMRFYGRPLSNDEVSVLAIWKSVADIAAKPDSRRTDAERNYLRALFFEHAAPEWAKALRDAVRFAARARKTHHDSIPTTMVMEDVTGRISFTRVQGQFDQPGEQVQPSTPAMFPPFAANLPRNRLGFARWLLDERHPLTSRVAVNRLWQQLFGSGFVDSPENFGMQTAQPVQAELLDWLATEFVRRKWDMKSLIKLMVMSATYRQNSSAPARYWRDDPDNRLLARGPRYRLPAAVVRDQALAVSGLLDDRLGGPSVFPYQPPGMWQLTSNKAYEPSRGKDLYRRSLYTYWRRSIAPPTMFLFDAPDREFCNVASRRTNTPLQALAALNETGFFEAARALAQRMMNEGGKTDHQRIAHGFRLVSAREPNEAESGVLLKSLKRYRAEFESDSAAADALIKIGDSKPDEQLAPSELAAFATVANMLLNMDKTLTKE